MSKSIVIKKPSKEDRDPNRLLLVNNISAKWLQPRGLVLSEEVLVLHGSSLGPMGMAVYVTWKFLEYMGKEPTVSSVAAYLGCQKVTVKKQLYRLQFLGLIEEQVEV